MSDQNPVKYVPAGTGPLYWGPGDRVTFLVTGAQSGGACFIIEVTVPPGGGPPPHIHHFEEESFYLLNARDPGGRADFPSVAGGFYPHPARHGAYVQERRDGRRQDARRNFAGGSRGAGEVL